MPLLKHTKTNQINMVEKNWENPSVRVIWEDYPENITQEKIKDVRQYFSKKYNIIRQMLMLSPKLSMRIKFCNK